MSIATWGAAWILAAGVIAAQAAPSIDIYGTDPDTGLTDFCMCQDYVAPRGLPMNISIFARLEGLAAGGISGAEFFVTERSKLGNDIKVFVPVASGGLGWSVSVVPNPLAAETMGNPFLETGTPPNTDKRANIAFAVDPQTQEGCQHGDADAPPGMVRLYDASIFKLSTGNAIPQDTYFGVGPGVPPSNPNFNCPVFTLCPSPVFTLMCVGGGQFIVNPGAISDYCRERCTVGTQSATWSRVKSLYR